MTLVVRDALVLWDADGERTGELRLDDGSEVVSTLDASGCVVTPGLVNAHHHLLQSGFRTLPGTRGVPMAQWLPTMAAAYAAAGIAPELVAATAAVGVTEGLLCGVTTVADHHLNWPHDASVETTVDIARAIADTAREIGSRLVYVRGSARDDAAWAGASADAIATALVPHGGVSDDGMLQVAVGPAGGPRRRAQTTLCVGP